MASTILVVDDDRDFREELRASLEEYRIVEASSGRAALQILKKAHDVGVVFLDVMMPDISGIDVLKEIKKLAPDVGIIILTGYSSKDVAIEALKAHADDYIEKPVDTARIREIIERFLDRRGHEAGNSELGPDGKIEKIKRFTARNISRNVGLKDVSSLVFLSPKYLSRVFKQKTGKGFAAYKQEMRMREAREMLKKGGYNINQISEKLGYKNAESFSRIFKKRTGFSPTRFRLKMKAKGKRASS
jgi:YesN/AraC family two-component response regulator